MSKAVEIVKRRQSELAIQKFQQVPDLRTESDFKLALEGKHGIELKERSREIKSQQDDDIDYLKFITSMKKTTQTHKEIPYYMLKIICRREKIPIKKFKIILKKAIREGIIEKSENSYIRIRDSK
jgi:hypothetical protein